MGTDRGSIPIVIAASCGVLVMTAASLAVGERAVLAARADAAADLAALAGATQGCAAAQRVAQGNGGLLESCRSLGADMSVTVTMPGGSLVTRLTGRPLGRISASALAGPPVLGSTDRAAVQPELPILNGQ